MPTMLPFAGAARGVITTVGAESRARHWSVAAAAAVDSAVKHLVGDRITALALCLTVTGWSLIWARALVLVALIPVWAAILVFLLGLALIPFRPAARPADV